MANGDNSRALLRRAISLFRVLCALSWLNLLHRRIEAIALFVSTYAVAFCGSAECVFTPRELE